MFLRIALFLGVVAVCFSADFEQLLSAEEIAQFRVEAVEAINKYRQKHGVPDVTLDNGSLTANAQTCADNEAAVEDSYLCSELGHGESINHGWRMEADAQLLTDDFYNGKDEYDFDNNSGSFRSRDFTQLVWKSTTEVGVGIVKTTEGATYFVHWRPQGNIEGKYAENVFRAEN